MNDDIKVSNTRKNIIRLTAAVLIAVVLAFVYFSADDVKVPTDDGSSSVTSVTTTTQTSAPVSETDNVTSAVSDDESSSVSEQSSSAPVTTVPQEVPPSETASVTTTSTTVPAATTSASSTTEVRPQSKTCSFMISCATVFDNKDKLRAGIIDILPRDGMIFPKTDVPINEGDTVYDVLRRICKENKIHMESTKIAATNSYYIEGIANLYEFDAGNLSGWMYSVNGKFPQTSSSNYTLSGGEKIEIVYSCNIGVDVGDDYFNKAG